MLADIIGCENKVATSIKMFYVNFIVCVTIDYRWQKHTFTRKVSHA